MPISLLKNWAGIRPAAERVSFVRICDTFAKDPAAAQAKFEADYKTRFANPYSGAERGYVDDVILPRTTRPRLIQALRLLGNKREELPRRKHGNIPL